ncbi:Helix-turn-helix domain-containing protein [Paenibacillus sp. UNCCL117]|uniref:helix-turn-helix transcriptional regulator n=1 Tax=unclassified Paenibacillus TaxID=185978 RepID=UPI000882988F|nr:MULTISPECIES: helix-turn-helix transcriptional regulator [unclassified Paenibacillus]SDD71370.1 Helix-turn-helix domain-containing protein [Paenibacillus sp. cl123]SFW45523.1 Helix-turn-helix domain-containing protein [Paenibacillus sp. UNCCL117]
MNKDVRLSALAEFLVSHRARLQPVDVGLPAGTRRRTPGLRREEVAQLAGVSTTWYTWLEQGREITVSPQVLECVAAALRLNEDERHYLFALASEQPSQTASAGASETGAMPPSLHILLTELASCPAIVSDRRCQIVGWNDAAAAVFMEFDQVPPEERNLIWLLFTRKEFRALAANWYEFVCGFLAIFRYYYGRYVGDPWYGEFIARLSEQNPDFLSIWNRNDVSPAPEVFIEFRHAKAGKMLFDLSSLQVQGPTDLRISVYTPSPGSDTAAKLGLAMKRRQS